MGVTEEAAFPTTEDNLENKTIALGKWIFNLGGVVHDFKDVLKRFQESMKHWSDRGPEDYEKNERDLRNLLASAVREGARRANVDIRGGYHEGDNGSWNKWMMPGIVTLIVTGIIGNVVQYATVQSLKTEVKDYKDSTDRRLLNLERKAFP